MLRVLELLIIFVALPLVFDQLLRRPALRRLLLPGLWLLAGCCLLVLGDRGVLDSLWNLPRERRPFAIVLGRWLVLGTGMWWLARRTDPEALFLLPKRMPLLWVAVLVAYPLLSVLPQGIVWRVYFVERYGELFGDGWLLLGTGALAFGFAHIIFRNALAVAITTIGGVLFMHTYLVSGSMLLAAVEHSLYGLTAFTLGLGRYLYLGAQRGGAPPQLRRG